ncbi:hypothetical protein F4779DRAFT_630744 [Xylariaceae sp. FL0662B]|nr:hypothetical protein F4779DRAFT_630744 [Xylariaceae sp. FL0662B]
MIGTSVPEYIFIRVCIFLLQYTTPLCIACLAVSTAVGGPSALSHPFSKVLVAYSIVDLLYAVFIYIPYNRRLGHAAKHPPPLSREERRALFRRCLDNVPDVRRYLRMWFLGADESEIRRDNVREFILWAYFDRRPGQESEEDEAELDEYIGMIEQRLGRKIELGKGSAKGLLLTLDEVETRYRSVVWYLLIGAVDLVSHCQLAWNGFQYHAQPRSGILSVIPPRLQNLVSQKHSVSRELGYWYRPHTATDKLPVVFLHGIGVGFYTYIPFLSRLNSAPEQSGQGQIGIIAIEMLPISFRLTGDPLDKLEFLRQMAVILDAHGWDKFLLASHSYGSVLATHMFQSEDLAGRIDSAVLIDPVSILLHIPDVAYNFTRRKPKRANEWQLWYFASMDPGVAHCLGRHFFWKDNIAWKEDLVSIAQESSEEVSAAGGSRTGRRSRRVAVCLSERDLIVDTPTVAQYLGEEGGEWILSSPADRRGGSVGFVEQDGWGRSYLTRDGIELFWFAGLDHAQVFDTKDNQDRLCSLIRRYCTR